MTDWHSSHDSVEGKLTSGRWWWQDACEYLNAHTHTTWDAHMASTCGYECTRGSLLLHHGVSQSSQSRRSLQSRRFLVIGTPTRGGWPVTFTILGSKTGLKMGQGTRDQRRGHGSAACRLLKQGHGGLLIPVVLLQIAPFSLSLTFCEASYRLQHGSDGARASLEPEQKVRWPSETQCAAGGEWSSSTNARGCP